MERRLLATRVQLLPENQTLNALFGAQADWQLNLEGHQLVLFPPSEEWLYLDPLHETWERTGFLIGEAIFEVEQGKLGAKRQADAPSPDPQTLWQYRTPAGSLTMCDQPKVQQQLQQGLLSANTLVRKPNTIFWRKASWLLPPPPTVSWPCPICDARLHEGQRFCSTCGTPVSQNSIPKVCPQCGHTPNPGAKFCGNCGLVLPVNF